MLKSKEQLSEQLIPICEKICLNKKKLKTASEFIVDNHGFSAADAIDMIQMKRPLYEYNEFELYCLSEAIVTLFRTGLLINEFFTSNEINSFKTARLDSDDIEFPIKIQCIKVGEDQWIGTITVDFLMKLRRAQLINYNTNAQRAMQRVVKGGVESYKISLNKKAVNQIRESMRNGSYISNTITLNMPDTTEYSYSQDKCVLIINSIDHFDMADGYHRYIAISQEKDSNPNFNYTMELRITNFSDAKTKQFIFQEDQKTRMSKINSDSMNMNKDANIILERLNQDVMFNLKGKISRNNGIINFADMAYVIEKLFFETNKKIDIKTRLDIENKIKEGINKITESYTELLERKWEFYEIVIVLTYIRHFTVKNNAKDVILKSISKLKADENLFRVISAKRITAPTINKVKATFGRGAR